MLMDKIVLTDWEVCGHWPYVPLFLSSMETGMDLKGVTPWIKAEVPGSVYKDLMNAGLIDDPYYEMNSLKCEWVANRWWVYRSTFKLDESMKGRSLELVFKGIDYKAYFYLNNKPIGTHTGMFRPAVFNIGDKVRYNEDNKLQVVFEHAPDEMSQIGHTSMTHTQKSRFNYKWDFSTRLVNIGLYDEVYIKVSGAARIEEVYLKPQIENSSTEISFSTKIVCERAMAGRLLLGLTGPDGKNVYGRSHEVKLKQGENNLDFLLPVKNPELWWPNGYGAQPLYDFKAELFEGESVSDSYTQKTGFRALGYMQNEDAPEDALPYTLMVNGRKIYIKGVNLTPLDLMYGCVGYERYKQILSMVKECNINLVRVWGGGIIESEAFYSLCDQYGILVWQEFIQSSSGIDSKPSENPEFLELLKETSAYAVKTRRNFVSHTFWSGGNELMESFNIPVGYDNGNISMLKELVENYDPGKLMLPSSASGPAEMLDPSGRGKNHDVHGPWQFRGAVEHYKLYNSSDSLFHSEFGCDGLSCTDSLKRFLSPENIGVFNMTDNYVWRHHGEWWDTLGRDKELFGEIESIEDFVLLSQFVQGTAIGYALEANRRRAFNNSGSIIWQFNEPYPNVSCTALVDYYSIPKAAYAYVKRAYAPLHVSMQFDKLVWSADEIFAGRIFVHNDVGAVEADVELEISDADGKLLSSKTFSCSPDGIHATVIGDVSFDLKGVQDVFIVSVRLKTDKGATQNRYIFWIDSEDKKAVQARILEILKSNN